MPKRRPQRRRSSRVFELVLLAAITAAQVPGQSTSFEVASIKPNTSGERGVNISPITGGRLRATRITLGLLIQTAYDIEGFQLSGGPRWLNTDRFDIEARAEGNPSLPQIREMLQNLLRERFHLALHREQKEMSVYVLAVDKGGAKLSPPQDPTCQPPPVGRCGGTRIIGGGNIVGTNISMSQLARVLTNLLLRPVVDRTSLPDVYNVQLKFSPESRAGEAPRAADAPLADPDSPSIFVALQEQAGLKLDSQRMPVDVLVIDGAEKPTGN